MPTRVPVNVPDRTDFGLIPAPPRIGSQVELLPELIPPGGTVEQDCIRDIMRGRVVRRRAALRKARGAA